MRIWAAVSVLIVASAAQAAEDFELRPGEHICLVGNTLAERMQYFGWLETRLVSRFPQHDLVFRNLGYSGDEITLRLRSRDFGTPDEWLAGNSPIPQPNKLNPDAPVRANRFELTNTKADVIFAFFGYNESFAGEAGLPRFQKDLRDWIRHTLAQKYNGRSSPRLVLFSPIAHEDLGDRNLPDGQTNNERLKRYTEAMAQVAKEEGVRFVDLFHPTLDLYARIDRPLTINGIHLNELGDELVSALIEAALFPNQPPPERDPAYLERLRRAINDKNFYWFHRYRTTDGYSTYGDRAFLRFTGGQTNYEVLQRELEVLDVQTANRDKAVWAVARGGVYQPVDDNLPPFIPVVTNKPGPLPDGRHLFLGGEEAIAKMTVHRGMKVSLFASEEQFPELVNPVQMAFDTRGRLWVAVWPTYPHWRPTDPMNDKLLIVEDTDGDGRADRVKTFADDLHNPTGFEFWGGGVLVAMAPNLVFLKDTDGDDRADVRTLVLHGLDSADTHHTANSFTLDPGGALYFQEGTFHQTQVETPWGPPVRCSNAGVFRFEPRTAKFETYVSFGFANPHGHVFDAWGQDIVMDGTGAVPYHGALFSGRVNYPTKHAKPPQVYQQRTRPCPGLEILSSRHFPEEMQGDLLVPNVIGFQGILRYKLQDQGASFTAVEQEPIVFSSDPNFRPADLEIGPDGALYFTDWQNPIIGHMQHNLRDPNRDKTHGRIYRVTYEGRPLLTPPAIAGEPISKLLDLLREPEDRVRYRARIELSDRPTGEVIAATEQWLARLDKADPQYERLVLEALWIHQQHNVVHTGLLERVLRSPDFRARAAAVRVLCYWRDRVSNTLELLRGAASDDHPRVRLEAVRAASFLEVPEAIEVALLAAEQPTDIYLDYVLAETHKTLEPIVQQAVAQGQKLAFVTAAGQRYFTRQLTNEQLLKEPRTRAVLLEILTRPGMQDADRAQAVADLARLEQKSEVAVVIQTLQSLDVRAGSVSTTLLFDLVRQLTSRSAAELSTVREELLRLAQTAQQGVLRQVALAALVQVEGSVEPVWTLATHEVTTLQDLVEAVPLLADPQARYALYDRLAALLNGLPGPLAAYGSGLPGRYVRIELPGRGTLTLAEVEVYSGGKNVARQGRATQKNTAHGGDASRAIDGNTSGRFADGGQTHTEENTGRPYWELDLGQEMPLARIVIYNRTDGDLGRRLEGFTLRVLDSQRRDRLVLEGLPAPQPKSTWNLEEYGPAAEIRRAAMVALTHVRGKEAETFKLLAQEVKTGRDRAAAIAALGRLPRSYWAADEAPALLEVLIDDLEKTPVSQRTEPPVLAALEFADALVSFLPVEQARQRRKTLRELGVRVIRLGTLFEKMSFDKDLLVVQAGRPVEFVLENSDLMPHNFVIVRPGALEEIGLASEAQAQNPQFAIRQYVPQSPKVLAASRLLQPRQTQRVPFVAPTEVGVYPYVCTYPGHWRRMYGALYVVEDLEAYEADPQGYLAAHPLPILDELLKDRRPRTEWQFEDLAADLERLSAGGRSYASARQMFTVASCVSCHRLQDAGNAFGPDLTQLDPKFQPADILRELIDPSARINEKYQTQMFQLANGQVISGLVLEETPDVIKLVENPLVKAMPIEIPRSEVLERKKSPTSLMPKGLLDKLSREEALDLIALVYARGKPDHPVFAKGPMGAGGNHHHAH